VNEALGQTRACASRGLVDEISGRLLRDRKNVGLHGEGIGRGAAEEEAKKVVRSEELWQKRVGVHAEVRNNINVRLAVHKRAGDEKMETSNVRGCCVPKKLQTAQRLQKGQTNSVCSKYMK
jgi:hypothetical protein